MSNQLESEVGNGFPGDRRAGTARRLDDDLLIRLMGEVRVMLAHHELVEGEKLNEIKREIASRSKESIERHNDLADRFEAMQKSTLALLQSNNSTVIEISKLLKSAFPDGDLERHRMAHERWIKKDEDDRKFWMDIKKQVVGWGLTAAIAWASLLLWAGFLRGPGG